MFTNVQKKQLAKFVCDFFGHEFIMAIKYDKNKIPSYTLSDFEICQRCGRQKHNILGILPEGR